MSKGQNAGVGTRKDAQRKDRPLQTPKVLFKPRESVVWGNEIRSRFLVVAEIG